MGAFYNKGLKYTEVVLQDVGRCVWAEPQPSVRVPERGASEPEGWQGGRAASVVGTRGQYIRLILVLVPEATGRPNPGGSNPGLLASMHVSCQGAQGPAHPGDIPMAVS